MAEVSLPTIVFQRKAYEQFGSHLGCLIGIMRPCTMAEHRIGLVLSGHG